MTGSIAIGPDAAISVLGLNGFVPIQGTRFTMVINDTVADPVTGSFQQRFDLQ